MRQAILLAVICAVPGSAQTVSNDALSLKDAVRMAIGKNQKVAASAAAAQMAHARIAQARAGRLPKVNYSEAWSRSDNPVFVFSSLLTQRQFGESNFAVGTLNRPGFLNNFQSQLVADQTLFDAGQANRAVRSAELQQELVSEEGRHTQMEVIANVIRCYYDALLSAEQLQAANQAMRSAQADLERAQAIRSAGLSTDVDVLSIRVHVAGIREQQISREADLEVARAALNDALGLPLDTIHVLTAPLIPLLGIPGPLAEHESQALTERPEARQVKLAADLARQKAAAARGAWFPQVAMRGALEADRQGFYRRGGANWLVSVGLRWNVFNGFGDRARIEESNFDVRRSEADAAHAGSAIRLQVRRAFADLNASQQRIEVARASVEEARESLRITQDRYAAGLTNVTDLLRAETASFAARTRHLVAIHAQRLAAVALEFAAGTLSAESHILNEGSRP